MSYQTVLLDRKDGIATITFHRPEALNAINSQMLEDLGQQMRLHQITAFGWLFLPERENPLFPAQIFMKWTAKTAMTL